MKKLLGIAGVLMVATLLVAPVYAEEGNANVIQPRTVDSTEVVNARETVDDGTTDIEIDCINDPTDESCIMLLEDEAPVSETASGTNDESEESLEIIEEEPEELEMWPVYVSLGALGAAIIVFVLLNFFTEQKK